MDEAMELTKTPGLDEIEKMVREKARTNIRRDRAIVYYHGAPLIYPNTINVIEGQAGSNKSRLAETICGAMVERKGVSNIDAVEPSATYFTVACPDIRVLYLDTERNFNDQLPEAIQQVKKWAGYEVGEDIPNLYCTSILREPRTSRIRRMEGLIEEAAKEYPAKHLFIVLDLVTDFLKNFNDLEETNQLIDSLGRLVNSRNLTFLCIIHQNPSKDFSKARGHLGTEIMNKATSVLEINYHKSASRDYSLFKLLFKKLRKSGSLAPAYFSVDDTTLMLRQEDIAPQEQTSAEIQLIADKLYSYFSSHPILSTARLEQAVMEIIGKEQTTAKKRIKEFVENETAIPGPDNKQYRLRKEKGKGNRVQYSLEEHHVPR